VTTVRSSETSARDGAPDGKRLAKGEATGCDELGRAGANGGGSSAASLSSGVADGVGRTSFLEQILVGHVWWPRRTPLQALVHSQARPRREEEADTTPAARGSASPARPRAHDSGSDVAACATSAFWLLGTVSGLRPAAFHFVHFQEAGDLFDGFVGGQIGLAVVPGPLVIGSFLSFA